MTFKNVFLLFSLAITLAFSACKKDTDTTDRNEINLTNVNQRLQEASWFITNYTDGATVDTALYSGYRLTFWWDDEVNGTRNGFTEVGTWTLAANGNSVEVTVSFPTITILGDLNGTWEVTALGNTRINFRKTDSNNELLELEMLE